MMRRLSFFLLLLLARCFFLSRAAEREKADQNRRLSDVSFFSNSPFSSSSEWKKNYDVFAARALERGENKESERERERVSLACSSVSSSFCAFTDATRNKLSLTLDFFFFFQSHPQTPESVVKSQFSSPLQKFKTSFFQSTQK